MPKLSHQLLKGQKFGADSARKVKLPIRKEKLNPNFDEPCSSIKNHLMMFQLMPETLQLLSYLPKSFIQKPQFSQGKIMTVSSICI